MKNDNDAVLNRSPGGLTPLQDYVGGQIEEENKKNRNDDFSMVVPSKDPRTTEVIRLKSSLMEARTPQKVPDNMPSLLKLESVSDEHVNDPDQMSEIKNESRIADTPHE